MSTEQLASGTVHHVHVNGVRIAYEETGAGVPLVLVHGSWSSRRSWDAVVPGLSAKYRVIGYDRRGHSESERPPGQGTFAEDVADLAALLDACDAAPAWVVGSSVGAVITLRLAAERPDLIRGVVVHEPPLRACLPEDASGPIRAVLDAVRAGDHAAAAERFVDEVAFGPGGWARLPEQVRATMTENAPTYLDEELAPDSRTVDESGLAAYGGPVLVTSGEQSPPIFARVAPYLARLLPQARHLEYAGAGHVPHVTHPREFVTTVRDFVAGRS